MADIRLAKPAAGTTQTVPSAPDGRFIFDFPADAATLTRSGDNLVLTFEDGASIQLQGFYTTYSKEERPSFQVDGVEISGQDFFAALGEDLMPAAGPAAGSSAARGGRYNEYGGSDLLDGIDHLGRLDVGFDGGVQLATDTVEPSAWYEGDGWVDHGVTVTPLDSDAAAEVVTVHEAGLANGTTPGAADAPVAAGGSLIINAPDGVASIVIGNVTVFENGALTGNTVSTDEGTLTVTGYDPATGRLDFNYTLDRNTTEHDKSDPATDTQISHDLTVTVTDTDGDSGSTTITVNVVDDGPKINLTGASSGLLVDETFGSNGSQDVNDGGTGTATLDASRLFDVDGGADGVADMSYSLTLSQQPNDLTAIVDGQEYNVTFAVFNGQVHAMAGNTGKDIFTVSINEDTGEVTLQLTGKGSLKHPTSSNDDEILNNIIDDINVKLTVTDNDGDVTSSEVQLEIQVEDDAVQVTSAGEPKLELDESDLHGTGVQDVVNVSNNFTVVASADGEAGRSYELTLDPGAENPLVAFVGGEMMPVILSINNEGRIVGMAGDTEIFNVHVDSKGNVTFTLENNGTLVHPDNSDPDDVLSLNGIGVKLTVTDGDGDSSSAEIALDLTIRDDGPTITASDMSTTLVPGSGAGNLADGEAADFTKGKGGQSLGHSTSLPGWGDVTMYAAKVTYSGSGDNVQISGIDDSSDYTLKYSPYNTNHPAADKGLTVDAGNYTSSWWGETQYDPTANHNEEISVIKDEDGKITQSEAVVFDLGGQLAYGVTIDFGAFYNGKPGAEGTTQWDHVSEKALVTFYRDGEIVGSTIVEGNSSTGTFTLNSSDVVLGGFDKVVISAVDNRTDEYWDEHSDFTIQGIDFITKRDDPFIVSEGKVTAESGADGFADAYADSHVQFDLAGMVNEDSLSEDGTSGTITVLVDGQPMDVTLTLREGASGESILTGTLESGEQLFTATLDKDGNWTMEQYEQFRVDNETETGSNQFELVFKTEDADGDVASTTVNVPLEVVDQTPATDTSIGNGADTITITGGEGIAGTVAVGDSGGVEVQTTVQPGQDYNISIMLDLSGSMDTTLSSDTNTTRIEMAVDALKNFFETSLQNHDGDICLQLVGFGTDVLRTRTWTIAGTATAAEKQRVYDEFANQLNAWQKAMNSGGYSQGTNYEAAMEKATEWFTDASTDGGVAGNDGENLAFFISDGEPTYSNHNGGGNSTPSNVVEDTLHAAQDLQNAGGGVHVNAIGIGTSDSLSEGGQKILDLIDNTGGSGTAQTEYPHEGWVNVGTWFPDWKWQWTTSKWKGDQPLAEGDSDLVNSKDGLTAALIGGGVITSTDLADAGDDEVDASASTSSVIVYGDVLNTDRLRYELIQNKGIEAALVAAGIDYGSGADVFQWLEDAANANALKGTKFEGWTHDDSVKYMLQHAEELGYETRVDADGDFYLVKADGTVLHMDGSEADIDDSLTGRDGGDDVITGSSASDTIYGQEGHDTIYGGGGHDGLYGGTGDDLLVGDDKPENLGDVTVEGIKDLTEDKLDDFIKSVEGTDDDGNDQLFGGVGDDVLLGMGGDDYIDGGAGEDAIFGGSGNDIIVYDSNDYLVSGGSGIDFMVSDNSTLTLTELLSGGKNGKEGPIVDSIEVLLKGDAALSLTSLDQLAKDYGITLDTNAEGKETLILDMDKWTKTADGIYAFNGGAEDGDLTLETNLTPVEASDPASEAVQQQVFTLEHGNG